MTEERSIKVMLTDGREFSIQADSFRRVNSFDLGDGHMFLRSGKQVCFVPGGQLAAIIDEDALVRGRAMNGAAAGRSLVKASGKGRQ